MEPEARACVGEVGNFAGASRVTASKAPLPPTPSNDADRARRIRFPFPWGSLPRRPGGLHLYLRRMREDPPPPDWREGLQGPDREDAPRPGPFGPGEPAGGEPETGEPATGTVEAHDRFPGNGAVRRLDPRVLPVWWIAAVVRAGVVTGMAAFVDQAVLGELDQRPLPPHALWMGVGLLALVVAAARPPLRYRYWRYALRGDDLWIRRGILWVTVSVIPYRRLQFADTDQGPLLRAFGLAELIVHTAAPGTSGRIPGLDADEAEGIRERLATLAPDHDAPT